MAGTKKSKRAVVFGYGSVGRRQAANLAVLGYNVDIITSQDIPSANGMKKITLADIRREQHQFGVIANRNHQHLEAAYILAELGIPMLMEKPLSHSLDGVGCLEFMLLKNKVLCQSAFVLRYHPCVQFVLDYFGKQTDPGIFGATTVLGSYLPRWRTNIPYEQSASAEAGVVMDMVHEFDYLSLLLGKFTHLSAYCRKASDLQTSEDWADILYKTSTKVGGTIHLDYLQDQDIRETRIVTKNGTVVLDLIKGEVLQLQRDSCKVLFQWTEDKNQMYVAMLNAFIDAIAKPISAKGLKQLWIEGVYALSVALACRNSSQAGKEVVL